MTKKQEAYPFLKIGYASFPLNDVGKKFEVADTFELTIKKPPFLEHKKLSKYMQLHINHRKIERALWEKIRKSHNELLKEADWLVISMISEFGDELNISLDMLKKI